MEKRRNDPPTRSVLLNFRFIGTALVGSLTMGMVSVFAPLSEQIATLGISISILAGLFLAFIEQEEWRERRRGELLSLLRVPLSLAPDHELFDQYRSFSESIAELARRGDPVLRRFAHLKLTSLAVEVQSLARGTIVFAGTETWRTVYEQLLESPGLDSYRSIAWVKTADYWQDRPGRQSMRLNFEMARRGMSIERILILREELWPPGRRLPASAIRPWIDEQQANGIRVSLVRESEILSEPDLLADFGIYGERATGIHELDEQGRTLRFILQFDLEGLHLASDRWTRLALYASQYSDLLDRKTGGD